MNAQSKKATIYLDQRIHRALRIKSAETNRPMSQLVNDAIAASLREDEEDLAAFKKRAHEPLVTFEQVLKELKRDGKI